MRIIIDVDGGIDDIQKYLKEIKISPYLIESIQFARY